MKLLLDENLPKKLKQDFSNYEIYTVRDKNWSGKKNGELLKLMIEEGFSLLITFDKNLQYQQNFKKYSLPVIVLNASDNTYITLSQLMPQIIDALKSIPTSGIIEIKKILA
jgi:predicted nuclease of predicted toxin-antitoxin system